jgi:transposase
MNSNCPKCNGKSVKNGFARGNQRYKCKDCAFQFTRLEPKGKPLWMKLLSILLYMSGMSINSTAKLFNVSPPAVLEWIRNFAIANYEKPEPEKVLIVELDEMWHFVESKKTNFGSGKLMIAMEVDLLTGNLETVVAKP